MQKISTYLYPNRIQLLADLAGFNTEYTNVYQRTVKLYKGIDNAIELDIKNADQKRIDLSVFDAGSIYVNVMDAMENPVGSFLATPLDQTATATKGLASFTILATDLENLNHQFLSFSVTATIDSAPRILYGDSRFGALGKMEVVGWALKTERTTPGVRIFTDFTAEIDLNGFPISKSSAIPATFYESQTTTELTFDIDYTGFKGKIWIEGTKSSTINTEAFKPEVKLHEFSELTTATTGTFSYTIDVGDYKYFRVRYNNAKQQDITSNNPSGITGKVDRVTVS